MHDLIYLIGYRGVGKSTVGKSFADSMGYDFFDTDMAVIEQKMATIIDIVAKEGWQKFRRCEKEILRSTKDLKKTVVATGGGAILHRLAWQDLRKESIIFWLNADEDVIIHRVLNDAKSDSQRPSLTGDSAVDEIRSVLNERIPFYQETAHYQVDTGNLTVEEAVDRMKQLVSQE